MTSTHAPRLTASTISALVRRAIGNGNAKVSTGSQIEQDGALVTVSISVMIHGAKAAGTDRDVLGRAVRAAALQAGYEVGGASSVLTITLPEPTDDEVVDEVAVEADRLADDAARFQAAEGTTERVEQMYADARALRAEAHATEPDPATVIRRHVAARVASGNITPAELAREMEYVATREQPAEDEVAAPAVTYRKVGEGLYEVALDGQAIGRVARTTLAHATFGVRWACYTTTGEWIASGATSRARAGERVVEHARFATVDADTITDRRELLAAIEVQTRHLGYASTAAYLQAPGREVTRARAEVAAYAPDGPAMPAGVGGCDCPAVPGPHLAHCDDCTAPADRCVCDAPVGRLAARYDDEEVERLAGSSAPGWGVAQRVLVVDGVDHAEAEVDDDPREQPAPVEWSEHAGA